MYFRFMCTMNACRGLSDSLSAQELADSLTRRGMYVANAYDLSRQNVQLFMQQLEDEAAQKIQQVLNMEPQQIRFYTIPSKKKNAVNICAIAKVEDRAQFYVFSDNYDYVEFFAKREMPLLVW